MLRLALVLSLAAGIAALVINFVVTQPAIETQTKDLADTKGKLDTSVAAQRKAEGDAKTAKANADKALKDLAQTRTELETAAGEATTQRGRADKLANDLGKTTKERNEAQQELSRWQVLGVQPDQIAQLKTDLREASEARAALADERKIFLRSIEHLQTRLDRFENPNDKPVEMPGLKGSVVAVDPKWNFVLLDVGENGGAKANGIVMVRRGDKLLGKARIVSVDSNRSIANLLPEWRQGDVAIAEGDKVLY
jgi:hypothetical protein